MILHENLHREEINPLDEGAWMRRYMEQYGISQNEMARRAKCSAARVAQLLSLLEGDPSVSTALRTGKISKAQALVINRIPDAAGREQGLHWAQHLGHSAEVIKAWADHREQSGVTMAMQSIDWESVDQWQQKVKNQAHCVLHDDYVDYNQIIFVSVCRKCWEAALGAIEWAQRHDLAQREKAAQEVGNEGESGQAEK